MPETVGEVKFRNGPVMGHRRNTNSGSIVNTSVTTIKSVKIVFSQLIEKINFFPPSIDGLYNVDNCSQQARSFVSFLIFF